MRILLVVALAFSLSSCSLFQTKPQDGTAPKISLKDFFKNSEIRSIRISPDGKKVAALMPYRDRMNVHVRDINSTSWKRLTDATDRDINNLFWKGNESIIYSRDFGGDENFHVFSVNLKTFKSKDLTPFKETVARIVHTLEDVSDNELLVALNKRNKRIFDIYRLNVVTGQMREILRNPGNHSSWVTDHNGSIRMAVTTDGVNNTIYYRKNDQAPFKKVITTSFKESLDPIYFDSKNKYVYALSNLKSNTSRVVLINPKNARVLRTIYSNKNYDISGLEYSQKLNKLISSSYIDTKYRVKFFDEYYKGIYQNIKKNVGDKQVYLTSSNKEEDLFSVYVTSDRLRGVYYLYNAKTKNLQRLANPTPWLEESDMAQMTPIKFTSRDGLTIEGYLTIPKGMENKKDLPLVVNPHGGPWARDVWGYNPEVQFLANRGYAVLQINFRGSTGFGRKFWEASFKQWGNKMQNDITDGVNWVIKKGLVDKNRVCIYGGSYGGYATLAGLTYTPNLYKCGVDYVGVSNLFTFMETIPPYWKQYLKMLHEMVGHPVKDKAMLTKYSPALNVEKIKSPLFIAQGAKDPRVKKSESDQMVEALKKRGIEVPYLVKDNEGHGFRNQENRFEFYSKMEKFLAKNIKF